MTDLNEMLDEMDIPKPWWQSRGIIGSLVVVAASAAGLFGYAVDIGATTEIVFELLTLAGGILAWWGRVKAVHPISPRKVLPGLTLGEGPV